MLSAAELAGFDIRRYTQEVKAYLRDDEAWLVLMEPALIERTRQTLTHMVTSIDLQLVRAAQDGTLTPEWERSITGLRRFVMRRLDVMPEQITTSNKETRAWKALSAKLAHELDEHDPYALDALKTPYGGLSLRQWLEQREEAS